MQNLPHIMAEPMVSQPPPPPQFAIGSKRGRGVVKGYDVSKRLRESENGKLFLSFSKKFGGAVGVNHRSFVDEIGVQVRQHVPIVGIEKWGQVSNTPKQVIKTKILDKFSIEDNKENETKIFRIAQERYKIWRSTLAATYRAYKTDEERLCNIPEELKIGQWKELISYFGSDKFKRDEDTGEELNELDLWYKTHTKGGGEWASETAKEIHENVNRAIAEKENELGSYLSTEEQDKIFHYVVGMKGGYVQGRGYMAQPSKTVMIQELQSQVASQASENRVLNEKVEELANRLDEERSLSAQRLKDAKQEMRDEFMFILANFTSKKVSSDGIGGGFLELMMSSGREDN